MNKTTHQLENKYSRITIKKACDFFEACGNHCTIDELFLKCEEINEYNLRRKRLVMVFSSIKRDKQAILNYISRGGGSLPDSVKIVSPI